MQNDVYRMLLNAGKETLYKEKGSKFFGYAFPVNNEDEVAQCLEKLKNRHPKAGHFCYAWQLGKRYEHYRANDDGEPSNSAGKPIYGQLQSFEITNILVVVVRYFGGTKLGVGGLISAYRTTAKMALEAAPISKKTINVEYKITFDYPDMNQVKRIIQEEKLPVLGQEFRLKCSMIIAVRKNQAKTVQKRFENFFGVEIEKIE